jgi:hypothetical protein
MALPVGVLIVRTAAVLHAVHKTGIFAGKYVETKYVCEKCAHTKKVKRVQLRDESGNLANLFALFEWQELCRVRGKEILHQKRTVTKPRGS